VEITGTGGDLVYYWAAASVFAAGGDPHDFSQLAPLLTKLPFPVAPLDVYLPPFAYPIILPLAFVPFEICRAVWLFFSIAIVGLIAIRTMNFEHMSHRSRASTYLLVATFYPIYQCIGLGQLSPILMLGLFALIFYPYSTLAKSTDLQERIAGFSFTLTLIKPQILFVIYLVLFVEFCKGRYRSFFKSFLLGAVILLLISAIINLKSYGSFSAQRGALSWFTPTLGAWLQSTAPNSPLLRFVPTILCSVGVLVFAMSRKVAPSRLEWAAVYTPISLFATPYVWTYDYSVLIIPNILLISLFSKYVCSYLVTATLLLANVLMLIGTAAMEYHIWYPVLIAALGIFGVIQLNIPVRDRGMQVL